MLAFADLKYKNNILLTFVLGFLKTYKKFLSYEILPKQVGQSFDILGDFRNTNWSKNCPIATVHHFCPKENLF